MVFCNGFLCQNSAMPRSSYGSGTIFERGEIWYVSFWAQGRQVRKSSGSRKRQDAVQLRDQLLGKKARGVATLTVDHLELAFPISPCSPAAL
jgi:hypothetical protein